MEPLQPEPKLQPCPDPRTKGQTGLGPSSVLPAPSLFPLPAQLWVEVESLGFVIQQLIVSIPLEEK